MNDRKVNENGIEYIKVGDRQNRNERFDLLMKQLTEKEHITEELKAENQLEWVGKMNNIKNCAEEMILKELIYV